MRLDSLGKPPLLQVVRDSKKAPASQGGTFANTEIKEVESTPEGSLSSGGKEKLGKILDILSKGKREKKKSPKTGAQMIIAEYTKAKTEAEPRQKGSRIDVQG